jgi:hypothetical protein
MALQIPRGAGEHACIEGYGLRWPLAMHVGDLGAISTRIRVEIAPRSRV